MQIKFSLILGWLQLWNIWHQMKSRDISVNDDNSVILSCRKKGVLIQYFLSSVNDKLFLRLKIKVQYSSKLTIGAFWCHKVVTVVILTEKRFRWGWNAEWGGRVGEKDWSCPLPIGTIRLQKFSKAHLEWALLKMAGRPNHTDRGMSWHELLATMKARSGGRVQQSCCLHKDKKRN